MATFIVGTNERQGWLDMHLRDKWSAAEGASASSSAEMRTQGTGRMHHTMQDGIVSERTTHARGTDHESDETAAERHNRNLSDLLQELRVAGLGVQMLFGFLLALPFTVRFTHLDGMEGSLYRASLVCAALATALLVSPVAYHRWVFRHHEKAKLLKMANVQALLGLAMVALAVCSAVWFVLMFLGLNWPTALCAAFITGTFAFLWFVLPIADRLGTHPEQPS